MFYSLKMNEIGQFEGYQTVAYKIGDCELIENQYFQLGSFDEEMCFTIVYRGGKAYDFDADAWGTVEVMRDAAELFALGGWLNCIEVWNENRGHAKVLPNNEAVHVE